MIFVVLALICLFASSGCVQERQVASIPPVTIAANSIFHETFADGSASKITAEGRVVVTISIDGREKSGTAKRAVYDHTKGSVILYGRPEVTTKTDVITATDDETRIILKEGRMEIHGAHKITTK